MKNFAKILFFVTFAPSSNATFITFWFAGGADIAAVQYKPMVCDREQV